MKLLTGPVSLFGAKVLIAAAEKGIALEVENVPFAFGQERPYPGHGEVDRINPKRQVPVLIDQQLELFDSTLINEYFEDLYPEPALWPAEPRSRAAARLIELKADEIWFPKLRRLGDFTATPDEAEAKVALAEALDAYSDMDRTLAGRSWMAGAFSYADIAVYVTVLMGAFHRALIPADLTGLSAWRRRMDERPSVRGVREGMLRFVAAQSPRTAEPA